jgi:hypothetical protein
MMPNRMDLAQSAKIKSLHSYNPGGLVAGPRVRAQCQKGISKCFDIKY